MGITLNYKYGSANAFQVADLYIPDKPIIVPTPLFITIHGGGWYKGDKSEPGGASYQATQRLYAAGYAVAAINYSLVQDANLSVFPNPKEANAWPAALVDAQAAVVNLKQNAATFNLDPSRFIAWGDSAGAMIALWLAIATPQAAPASAPIGHEAAQSPPPDASVAGAIGHSTACDFSTVLNGGTGTTPMFCEAVKALINVNSQQNFINASLAHFITASTPPLAFTQGSADPLVNPLQGGRLNETCKQVGMKFNYQTYDGGHVFRGLTPAQAVAIEQASEAFILGAIGK